MESKKVALFTTKGLIGQSIADEVLKRGYKLTVIVHDTSEFPVGRSGLKIIRGDVNRYEDVSKCAMNHDVVIYDQVLRRNREGECYNATRSIIMGCKAAHIKSLIISGRINPVYPEILNDELDSWRPVQEEQLAALELLERELDISWSFFYTSETEITKKSNRFFASGNGFSVLTPAKQEALTMKEYVKALVNEIDKGEETQMEQKMTALTF